MDFSKVDRTSDEYVDRVVELSGSPPERFSAHHLEGFQIYASWYSDELRFVAMGELELLYQRTRSAWRRRALRKEAWRRSQEM